MVAKLHREMLEDAYRSEVTADIAAALAAGTNAAATSSPLAGYLYGLTLANNATDGTNDIDIAAGSAASSGASPQLMTLAAALTKRLDAAWAVGTGNGGLDTGSIADTTYHVHLIKRTDTNVVDALFSTSATAPTMPANYTLSRRIGSIVRASSAIRKFIQEDSRFFLESSVRDVATSDPGTSAVTSALTVPAGIKVTAHVLAGGINGTSNWVGLLSSLDAADIAPNSAGPYNFAAFFGTNNGSNLLLDNVDVRTNTSRQVRYRISATGVSNTIVIVTTGWTDHRGKNG